MALFILESVLLKGTLMVPHQRSVIQDLELPLPLHCSS